MNQGDIANMADFIAQQIHHAAAPDETWNDLDETERNEFRIIAHAAMGAHDAWLVSKGYRIVQTKKVAKPKPGFIVPKKPTLVLPH